MTPKTRIGVEIGVGIVGSALGQIAGAIIAEKILEAWEKRSERKKKMAEIQKLIDQERLNRLERFNEKTYPQLYGKQLFEQETKPVIDRMLAEKKGIGPNHAIFVHEDTQPVGKKNLDGCRFSVWDWDTEIEERTIRQDLGSFHITQDEFEANEYQFEQRVCTYYADTNTLMDEDGMEFPYVPNMGFECVGELANVEWGKGARRSDTIYLRNELLEEEYHIVRDEAPPPELILAFGERMGDDLHHLEGHKDPKGW